MMTVHWAFISVGSNLGDRLSNCCRGIAALCADASVRLVARSPFYETEPLDYTDQEWFLNAAVKIETDLAPLQLLARLQAVQKSLGRREAVSVSAPGSSTWILSFTTISSSRRRN
jgi:2-amino-4-hydroxy-6-hydroxymethyldihydropteridine diphosphokinase